jgi:transposase
MSNRRLDMINVQHLIRQLAEGKSYRVIGTNLAISPTTVKKYSKYIRKNGLDVEELKGKPPSELEVIIDISDPAERQRAEEALTFIREHESALIARRLTRKAVYEKYRVEIESPLSYSRFCVKVENELKKSGATMHFDHKPGDKLFVDFAGDKLCYYEKETGKKITVEIFVAVLGHSQKTFVFAVHSQCKNDFIEALKRALEYYGGVPCAIVPDNLKSGVNKASLYEPEMNRSFKYFCEHYGCFAYPARPRSPKDKSLVENAVGRMYRDVYAHIKSGKYYSIEELNAAILEKLEESNNKPFQRREYSRNDLFENNERACLSTLPSKEYEAVDFYSATVRRDYHIWFRPDKHQYSVPYEYIGKTLKIIYNTDTVEIFYGYTRIAVHKRNRSRYGFTTNPEHMPANHKYIADLTPENLMKKAEEVGVHTSTVIEKILGSGNYYDQRIRSTRGILSLANKLGKEIIERCCKRALSYGIYNYRQIKNIADMKLYLEEEIPVVGSHIDSHQNKRGVEYYFATLLQEPCNTLTRISYDNTEILTKTEAKC